MIAKQLSRPRQVSETLADSDRESGIQQASAPPARIGGYELGERLGIGGMAEVFEAFRTGPHGFRKRVALKRILPHVAVDPAYVAMFIEEASLVAQCEHPNIVHVFDFGEDGFELYLAMELVEGVSVGRMLRVLAARGDAVPLDVALHVTVQAARALAYAHRLRDASGVSLQLVHRDVSPGNLLLTRLGHLKLADFGIARTQFRERHTDARNLRGKIGYMSPEQVNGEVLTAKSDVFTLAIILAEMLLGETLFAHGPDLEVLLRIRQVDLDVLARTRRRIPSDVRQMLLSALRADPDQRPDARTFAEALESIMGRRGLATNGAERVARLLQRYELVVPDEHDDLAHESGARPTSLIELDALTDPQPRASIQATASPPPRASYIAKLAGGESHGPVPFPELVRLATTGVVDASTPIFKNRADAGVRACELPELSRIFATPALQWASEEIRAPRNSGELRSASLLPLIHGLYAARETGMLYLSDGERKKKVYFVDGRPDFVASTSRKEMLGQYLVDRGHCMSMEVDMGLALMPHHAGRLGDALVNLGVLRPVQLYRAVTAQVRERYLEAFGWRKGEWLYVREARSKEETYPIEQDVQVLMRDAAMQLHPSELEAALSPMWEKVVRPTLQPPAPLSAYQVPDAWHWVITQARGETTVGSLFARCCRQSGLDEEDALRALFLGVSCELLEAA
jgi:eukaryotic-like serine/threonine-protein kinase